VAKFSPNDESEPDVGFYGVCGCPHSTLNTRQKTSLLKGFNVGVNATVLAAKRAGEGRHRRFGMGMQVT